MSINENLQLFNSSDNDSQIRVTTTHIDEPHEINFSSIKLKEEPKEENVEIDFLQIHGLNDTKSGELDQAKGSKIHKDMEYKLGHIYEDNGLTVVSEEASKQFTEYNFGMRSRNGSSGIKTDYSGSMTKGSGIKVPELGKSMETTGFMGKSESSNRLRGRILSYSTKQEQKYLFFPENEKNKSDFKRY
jgi:hypothetical protein